MPMIGENIAIFVCLDMIYIAYIYNIYFFSNFILS